MPTPLLTTKLYIPSHRPDLVPRPRLIEQLNTGLSRILTLISAPAGFGKSTLLSSWAAQIESSQVAWLSLDTGDNDLTRFLTYFIAALQTIDSNIGQKILTALQSPGTLNSEIILTTLLNEIVEFLYDFVLIIDDYHVIESKPIDQALTFLLDHQPANMHLVIATRIDPPLPLARLRASGQMTELRTAKLRFTNDEVTAYLNQVMGLGLSVDDIAALETRTEGWIVGLQLAALSLQEKEDVTGFIRSFTGSHHHVLDYLVEEVLGQQTPETQSFLLQTSILGRLSGPLCDAVFFGKTEIEGNSQKVLENLDASNLFIVPLDDERHWYRYHHLFADMLQVRLKRFYPEHLNNLHLRAADWFQENDFFDDAVEHAFSASNYDRVASLIERIAGGTMLYGRLTCILEWFNALPQGILDSRPRLRIYQAWSLAIAGQPKVADKILLDVKASLRNLPDSPVNLALRGELSALRTGIIIYHNDPYEIIQEAEEALAHLPDGNLVSRARVYMALGTAYAYSNEMQKATDTYERGRDLALKVNASFLATANIELLTEQLVYQRGRLRDGVEALEQILELGKTSDGDYQAFTGAAHVLLAEINLEWNNFETAAIYLEKGFELLQLGGIGYTLTHCYCAAARIKLAFGETDRAIEYLQSASQAAMNSPLMHFQIRNLACQVKFRICMGDIETASDWATGKRCELPEILPRHLQETKQISLARVYLAQGDSAKTLDTLNGILPQAESAGRMVHVIDIYLLKALAHKASGESGVAVECMEAAITLAAPEGYIRTFVEHGEPMSRLLRESAERDISTTYVNKLLSAFDSQDQSDLTKSPAKTAEPIRTVGKTYTTNPLMEPLTDRELEVLCLMAEGLTYNEIAGQIMVSLNTVRTHVKNIYSKLFVHKRSRAISKAKELNIL
jgi:LuxR family maltose regulon positive regulatory protein